VAAQDFTDVDAVRIQEFIAQFGRIARESDLDARARIALDAACAYLGSNEGRIVRVDDAGEQIVVAAHGDGPFSYTLPIVVAGTRLGALTLNVGDLTPVESGLMAALVDQMGHAIAHDNAVQSIAAHRARFTRLAHGVRSLRDLGANGQGLLRLTEAACDLVEGAGAVLVSGAVDEAHVVASTGLDPLSEYTLAGYVARDLDRLRADGRPWAGALPRESHLREWGIVGIALVCVPRPDGPAGTLAVVTSRIGGLRADDLEALQSLVDHGVATMAASALNARSAGVATIDPVTRLFNRQYFVMRLAQEVQRAIRSGEELSLIVVGIDGLDDVRAREGVAGADLLLGDLAEQFVSALRASDVGCRISDDEMAMILPSSGGLDAFRIAERLRHDARIAGLLPQSIALTAGVASFPLQASDAEQTARFATAALALGRRHGGDRTFLFDREVAAMIDDQDRRDDEVAQSLLTTIIGVAAAVDDRHPTTRHHSEHVAEISVVIGRHMGLSEERLAQLRIAGLVHDVGKIGMSAEVLSRPGPLAPDEWDEVHQHPEVAYRMLSGASLGDVRDFVRAHHEWFDGSGYPLHLAGDAIPLESRILGVANALDAMTHDRPYRGALSLNEALHEIHQMTGVQFCPDVVAVLDRCARDAPMEIFACDPSVVAMNIDVPGRLG